MLPHPFKLILNGVNPCKPLPQGLGNCDECYRKNYGSEKDARTIGRTQRSFWNVFVWRCSSGYWHHRDRRDPANARKLLA